MTRKASGARRRLALVAIAATVCVGVWGTDESAWAQVSPAAGGSYYVSPDGSDEAAGTQEAPFRTIQRAASLVEAGNPAASADLTFKTRR